MIAYRGRDDTGALTAGFFGNDFGGKVVVEGINQVTKHTKPSQANPQCGIVQQDAAIDVSNVMYVSNGKASRVGFKIEDGKKVRYAKATGEVID